MPPRGYISEKTIKRSEKLRKPIVCACGCGERIVLKEYHFWPNRPLPRFKRGHFDTTGFCGHPQTSETRKKIGKGLYIAYAAGIKQPSTGNVSGEWVDTKKGGRIYCASLWEKRRCEALDSESLVLSYQKHPFSIPYFLDGVAHIYFPDFLVQFADGRRVLEEVKGWVRNETVWKAKKIAARRFCKRHGLTFTILDSLLLVREVKKIA